MRGARDADGNQRHLLAALAGRTAQASVIAAQAEAGVKANQVPMAREVPGQIDLHGTLVSAGALRTVKATAGFIHQGGGEFVLPVKENRKALLDAIDALPWHEVPVAHPASDRGHGRITTRTIRVLPAPEDLPFPHAGQVMLIEQYVTGVHGSPVSAVAALGVASPAPEQVSAAGLAWHVREQWAIESLHWLRDTTYQEGKSQVRTCACSGAPMSPKPPDGPVGPWTGHSHPRPLPVILKRPWSSGLAPRCLAKLRAWGECLPPDRIRKRVP